MTHPLEAFIQSLQWEQQNTLHPLQLLEQEIVALKERKERCDEALTKSHASTGRIHPELEINRLCFITQVSDQQRKLGEGLLYCLNQKECLLNTLEGIRGKIKMLERVLERRWMAEKSFLQKQQEQALDEWVLNARYRYEC